MVPRNITHMLTNLTLQLYDILSVDRRPATFMLGLISLLFISITSDHKGTSVAFDALLTYCALQFDIIVLRPIKHS